MTVITKINPDWQMLRDEISEQARAACRKIETALSNATEPPPLHLGEALEDAANDYLDLFEEISALYIKACRSA